MKVQSPFSVITPTVDGDVLSVLANADTTFTIAQVHRIIGKYSEEGVRKAMYRLVDEGIVTQHSAGRTQIYELNRTHLAADAITAIAGLWGSLLGRIRTRLAEFTHPPDYAALFGSAARHEMRSDSDIDIFLVRPRTANDDPAWDADIAAISSDISAWTGNDARVLVLSDDELADTVTTGERVLSDIARDGVTVYGDPAYLNAVGVR